MIQGCARVILINRDRDVLFLRYDNKVAIDPLRPEVLKYWVTPGGALEPGESFQQAAIRELDEETGIHTEIGPWVWTRHRTFRRDGALLPHEERYFVAWLNDGRVRTRNRTSEDIVAARWWSLNEIVGSSDKFLPPGFASLVQPIIAGDYPVSPLQIDTG